MIFVCFYTRSSDNDKVEQRVTKCAQQERVRRGLNDKDVNRVEGRKGLRRRAGPAPSLKSQVPPATMISARHPFRRE